VNDGEKLVIKKLETTENLRDAPLPVHMFGEGLELAHET
jgi:hypothetical protein